MLLIRPVYPHEGCELRFLSTGLYPWHRDLPSFCGNRTTERLCSRRITYRRALFCPGFIWAFVVEQSASRCSRLCRKTSVCLSVVLVTAGCPAACYFSAVGRKLHPQPFAQSPWTDSPANTTHVFRGRGPNPNRRQATTSLMQRKGSAPSSALHPPKPADIHRPAEITTCG